MIVNLNAIYRELALSFYCSSRADLVAWTPWVIFKTVYDRFISTTSTAVCNLLLRVANGFRFKYSKRILVLLRLGLDSIE